MNFKQHEQEVRGFSVALDEALSAVKFDADGLIPAIAQQQGTGEVLMLAWMNREALEETLKTGQVCYYSRSRGKLWRKGESSGQWQKLVELRFDCDGDCVLLMVEQAGAACHTGRRDCFYWKADGDKLVLDRDVIVDPATLYS